MCIGHLYGVSLYYGTSIASEMYHGVSFSRPEPLYFWVYFVAFNFPWAAVPVGKTAVSSIDVCPGMKADFMEVLLFNSTKTILRTFRALDTVDGVLMSGIADKKAKKTQ